MGCGWSPSRCRPCGRSRSASGSASGSRDESGKQAGASHYLEHLLFKGTKQRSALEISSAIDRLGGEINAFTAKEFTCFYARVLDSDLPVAVDVVTDMVLSSTITGPDFESERGVILEEIAMHDDDPGDVVHDTFAQTVFGDTPLGRPILGLGRLDRHAQSRHGPPLLPTLVPTRAHRGGRGRQPRPRCGGSTRQEGVRVRWRRPHRRRPDHSRGPPRPAATGSQVVTSSSSRARPSRSTSFSGVPGVDRTDPRRFALGVLNSALGGGMSSRLFQEVREKRGLAYSVYSYHAQYSDAGLFGVYAGCLPKKVDDVLDLCRAELQRVCHRGITARRAGARQGPAARIARSRHGGHRLAHEPHRQG